jgi:hypothetical protein
MSKIAKPKHFLLTKISDCIIKIYGKNLNEKIIFYYDNFLLFLRKKDLGDFLVSLYETF